jgi:hypothetical protein
MDSAYRFMHTQMRMSMNFRDHLREIASQKANFMFASKICLWMVKWNNVKTFTSCARTARILIMMLASFHLYSFIHLFIHSFIHLFIHSFIHSFIHLFIYSFIHLFIHSCYMQDVSKNFINETVHNNLCKYEQQNETRRNETKCDKTENTCVQCNHSVIAS